MDTQTITRTTQGGIVEANGAQFRMTVHHHDQDALGLRTAITEWITDADRHNGSHPAGTVVTRVLRGHMGRKSGVMYSETIS